jgi:hypothetical protein
MGTESGTHVHRQSEITVEVTDSKRPKCERCRRYVPWLINLKICGRCRDVCVEAGWIAHDADTGTYSITELGRTVIVPDSPMV